MLCANLHNACCIDAMYQVCALPRRSASLPVSGQIVPTPAARLPLRVLPAVDTQQEAHIPQSHPPPAGALRQPVLP